MTVIDPFEVMRLKLKEMKSSIELSLATGFAKDYIEYSRMVGEYSALEKMEAEVAELEQRYIES